MKLVESVTATVAPVVASLGIELVDVEHQGAVLRLVVDEPGGIQLDRIAEVTRAASRALDLADPLPSAYTLEVSSPGLERPLRTPAHFARAVGQQVSVRARASFEGERRLRGVLVAAGDDDVVVRTGNGEVRVPYDQVDRAKTVFEYGPAPKPGKVGSRPKGATPKKARPGAQGEGATTADGPGEPDDPPRATTDAAEGPSGRERVR